MDNNHFLISTKISNIDVGWVQQAFGHEDMYWAQELPKEHIELLLSKSITLGLYKITSPSSDDKVSTSDEPKEKLQQIGMARFMTDFVTCAYLSDVYIEREYRGDGIGKWLVGCCKEVENSIPYLRRGFLLTDPDVGKKFYGRELGYNDIHDEYDHVVMMTRKTWKFASESE